MRIAEGVAAQKGILKGNKISSGWWRRFCARNPELSLRSGDATAGVRIDAVNEKNMLQYFALSREVYDDLDFGGHPEHIYNMDETGVPLDPRLPKVVAKKGQRKGCSSSLSGLSHWNSTPDSSKVSPLSICSSSNSNKSIISKFLPTLPSVAPSRSSSVTQSRAWVITSKKCLEHLEEKEKKKQQDKEEKEKRKLERERKKQEHEQEMKRKAKERAKKAEEKAKREEEKAKKSQERALQRAKKAAEKATASVKGKAAPTMRKRPHTKHNTCTAASSDTGMSPTAESEPKPKAPRLNEDSINTDECCACFGLYTEDIETGREWLECACGRWIHEECIEDIACDANGKEKYALYASQ